MPHQPIALPTDQPPRRRLRIDTSLQTLQLDDLPPIAVRGRLDLHFLAALVAGRHLGERRAVTAATVAAGWQAAGLVTAPPTAKDWHRIVERLNAVLARLVADGAAPAVLHAPRGKTAGPWWLALPVGMAAQAHTAPGRARPPAGGPPRLAESRLDADAMRLAGVLKSATELIWNGLLDDAVGAFGDRSRWQGESGELRALRLLRRADTQITLGRHAAARVSLAQAASAVRGLHAEVLMQPHLQAVQLRCDYAENPQQHHTRVARALRPLAQAWSLAPAGVDAAALGDRLNLLCLCERRAVEAVIKAPHGRQPDLGRLLAAAHGALFCFLLVQNHEKTQSVCANLAYAHQCMAAAGRPEHWQLALEWHTLSFGFSEGFQQSENSAWELIFLGELWLASPEARSAFASARLRAAWRDHDPSTLAFYVAACAIAEGLNDPRQTAYAWLNRLRFATDAGLAAERRLARASLDGHLARHPPIRALLVAEGYELP